MAEGEPGMKNSEEFSWLEKEIVPKIAAVIDKEARNFRCDISRLTDRFFLASIYLVELVFCSEIGSEREGIRLVVKVPPKDENSRVFMRSDILFQNEIDFYQHFGRNYSDYPKCVLLIPEPITSAVIVLENLTHFGYKSMQPSEDVDMKRVLAAVREIGKFHARGYVLKEKSPDEFFGVAKKLREFLDDSAHPVLIELINTVAMRPLNYLRSVNYDEEFCRKMSPFLTNTHEVIFRDSVRPKNELAVLCHGDFNSNNVLYKDEDGGDSKAMLIDFAQFRYASPATDLTSFLHLSCKDETRKNFPAIFRAYHNAVLEYLEHQGIQDLERYSYEAFLKDYKRHAILGYAGAVFFMPVVHLDYRLEFDKFVENKIEHFEHLMTSGGDQLSKRLADMLLELKDNGCLDHIMGGEF